MVKVKNFSENLEESFSKLGAEIKRNIQKEEFKDKPIEKVIKYTLENYPFPEKSQTKESTKGSGNVTQNGAVVTNASKFLPSYMDTQDEKVKKVVENLVDLVFKEGLEKALSEIRFYPPFIVDAFHDALIDKIIPELKKRGVIKE